MAGAMLTNSSFARKVQEEIHGREKSPSPSLTVYYRGQIKSTLGYLHRNSFEGCFWGISLGSLLTSTGKVVIVVVWKSGDMV